MKDIIILFYYSFVLFFALCNRLVIGIIANPQPFFLAQPDGMMVAIILKGDEQQQRLTDLNDFTVLIDETGAVVYAQRGHNGALSTTSYLVGDENPKAKGLQKGLRGTTINCFRRICGGIGQSIGGNDEDDGNSDKGDEEENVPEDDGNDKDDEENNDNGDDGKDRTTGGYLRKRPVSDGWSISNNNNETDTIELPNKLTPKRRGTLLNLVVPIMFADHTHRTVPSTADIDILMNHNGPHELCWTGSVKDAFLENSYGQLTIDSHVTEWILLPRSQAYYADGNSGTTNLHEAFRYALDYLDENQLVNFTQFDDDGDGFVDSIIFLHSGFAAEHGGIDSDGDTYADRIWSHHWQIWSDSSGDYLGPWQSPYHSIKVWDYSIGPSLWGVSGNTIGRIGVIIHEMGHLLGLPDLYYFYSSETGFDPGAGNFCVMANAWGIDDTQMNPPQMCAWSKLLMGWLFLDLPLEGINFIGASETTGNQLYPQVYKIGDGSVGLPKGEYLLVENRELIGLDSKMSHGGLVVYHVNDNMAHSKVTVLQPAEEKTKTAGPPEYVLYGNDDDKGDNSNNKNIGISTYSVSAKSKNSYIRDDELDDEIQNYGIIANISVAGEIMSFSYTIESNEVDEGVL